MPITELENDSESVWADKHIPLKTSRSVSSVPLITLEIRRKICKKNETQAKLKIPAVQKLDPHLKL